MTDNKKSIDELLKELHMETKADREYISRLPDHAKDGAATMRDIDRILSWRERLLEGVQDI